LTPEALHSIAKDMLGSARVPEGLVHFLHEHSEGNPFFAAEYLRAALLCDVLQPRASGAWVFDRAEALETPRSLGALFSMRLAGLSPSAAGALQLAAVLGREFDIRMLVALPGAQELATAEAVEELVARQLIEWVAPGRYRFSHDKFREAQEQALSPERRRELHLVAAERMEIAGRDAINRAELGVHWARAGKPERALPYLEQAAREAALAHAPHRASELYRLAIEQCGRLAEVIEQEPDTQRTRLFSLQEARGDALLVEALHHEARAVYERARTLLQPGERVPKARIHRKTAASYWTLHEYELAQEHHEQAALALGDPDPGNAEAIGEYIEVQIGKLERLYFSREVGAETETLIVQLQPLIEAHATAAQRCYFCVGAACELLARGRYAFNERAVALSRLALGHGTESLARNLVAQARFIVGFMLVPGSEADCRDACDWFQRAETDARASGDSTLLSRILVYHGLALLRLGQVEPTRAMAARALQLAESVQLPPYVGAALGYQAWAEWRTGDIFHAGELARRALDLWRIHPHAFPFQWSCALPLLDSSIARDSTSTFRRCSSY